MCGILGQVYRQGKCDPETLRNMRDSMIHRGPDDSGEWYSSDFKVGLAHRRLSIIDLTEGGHQPMVDATKQFVVTFNGEIYNYQDLRNELRSRGHNFRTTCDTEVLLEAYRAWGTNCLDRLNGMFAFCIYDIGRRQLFLARDRAGEKPLFYTQQLGAFSFASELKALMRHRDFSRTINITALESYFTYGYVSGEHCILDGVYKLPPGHAMTFDLATHDLKKWRYWDISKLQIKDNNDVDDLSQKLELLLEDSVRRQLVADVPVGILLSGGVDSSLITAMASRVSTSAVRTFTISFPGEDNFNEGPYAKLIANHFGTQHTELISDPVSGSLLVELARQFDEPICDPSLIPTFLISKLISQTTKVVLGGDGGDELFGGYPAYSWIFKQKLIRKLVPRLFRQLFSGAVMSFVPHGLFGRNVLLGLHSDLPYSCSQMNVLFDRRLRSKLVKPFNDKYRGILGASELEKAKLCDRNVGLPGMYMVLDFLTYLPDDVLVKVDRASMLNSLEIRAPFLDYRVVEFAYSQIPNRLKANNRDCKILLKHLASRLLPKALDLDRKQGFSIPLKSWLRTEFGNFVKEVLNDVDRDILDPSEIGILLENEDRGYLNSGRLFAITMFELWRKEYGVKMPDYENRTEYAEA